MGKENPGSLKVMHYRAAASQEGYFPLENDSLFIPRAYPSCKEWRECYGQTWFEAPLVCEETRESLEPE